MFEVTASAYRNGVIDKGMAVFGDAVERAMEQTGRGIGDFVNRLDEASEKTVMRLDRVLERSGPLLRLAASDRVMALASRLLDVAMVRRLGVAVITKMLVKATNA